MNYQVEIHLTAFVISTKIVKIILSGFFGFSRIEWVGSRIVKFMSVDYISYFLVFVDRISFSRRTQQNSWKMSQSALCTQVDVICLTLSVMKVLSCWSEFNRRLIVGRRQNGWVAIIAEERKEGVHHTKARPPKRIQPFRAVNLCYIYTYINCRRAWMLFGVGFDQL